MATADIDFFKAINDRYGHPTGDAVLCAVADLLRDNCRPSDTVARVGGEEFLLVLEDSDAKGAWQVCERLRRALERHAWAEVAPELAVTLSFGIAEALGGMRTPAACWRRLTSNSMPPSARAGTAWNLRGAEIPCPARRRSSIRHSEISGSFRAEPVEALRQAQGERLNNIHARSIKKRRHTADKA